MEVKTSITIRFADIDSLGHVNNAVYLSYFEVARIDFFAKTFPGKWDWKKDGIVLVKNEIQYLLPIFLNDNIFIKTNISKVGSKSLEMTYEIFKLQSDEEILCSKGASVLVAFDYAEGKSKEIPASWKELLT